MHEEKELIKIIKKCYSEPPKGEWLVACRTELVRHAVKTAPGGGMFAGLHGLIASVLSSFSPRLALAGTAVALLALTGFGSSYATRGLLPSSKLYPLKLAVESAQKAVAVTEAQKADYSVSVATERVNELSRLTHDSSSPKSVARTQLISETAKRYSEALNESAAQALQLKQSGDNDLAMRTAQKIDQAAKDYTVLLSTLESDTSTSVSPDLEQATILSMRAQEAAGEILGLVSAGTAENTANSATSSGAAVSDTENIGTSTTATTVPELPQPSEATSTIPAEHPNIPSIMPNLAE
jgi:hypothetical protein